MKNKPKDMVTLEWLLPSLNQQLTQVAEDWQLGSDNTNPQQTVDHYQEIIDALTIADLPVLVELADKLRLLIQVSAHTSLADKDRRTGMLSHQLLQHELMEYVETGSYHTELLSDTVTELTRILATNQTTQDISVASMQGLDSTTNDRVAISDVVIDNTATDNIDVMDATNVMDTTNVMDVTDIDGIDALSKDQYQQLLFAWRQQVQQLLTINENHRPILKILKKVSHYLKQTATNAEQERLWHLTTLWLSALAHNHIPLPEHYASLLASLEQVIESIPAHNNDDTYQDTQDTLKTLTNTIYIELLALNDIDEQTLTLSHSLMDESFNILSHTLTELETVIFNLDNPQTVASSMHRISMQLEHSGQSAYADQARITAQDTEQSMSSEAGFASQQWQIEHQLQELYSDIYRTLDDDQATDEQIDNAAPETTAPTDTIEWTALDLDDDDFDDTDNTYDESSPIHAQALDNTDHISLDDIDDIDFEDINFEGIDFKSTDFEGIDSFDNLPSDDIDLEKQMSFDENEDDQKLNLKAKSFDVDKDTHDAFIEKSMEVISDLQDFLPIWEQDPQDPTALTEIHRGFFVLTSLSRMVDAASISEMTASIEHLLNDRLDNAKPVQEAVVTLVTEAIAHLPEMVSDFSDPQDSSFDASVIVANSRHLLDNTTDDLDASATSTNAIEVDNELSNSDDINDHFDVENVPSKQQPVLAVADLPAALLPFMPDIGQLPLDANDADPDIKDIFIEEAEEVLAEISPLFEEWQHNLDNLTLLQDIRRGFHTLKGSGRMVGANYTAELAWSIENMLNRILDGNVVASAPIKTLISDVLTAYPDMMDVFAAGTHNYPADVPLWIACANAYSQQLGDAFDYNLIRDSTSIKDSFDLVQAESMTSTTGYNVDVDSTLQTIYSINEVMAEAPVAMPPQSEEEQEFCKIFIEEAEELLQDINDFVILHKDATEVDVSDDIVRAFHTLRAASGSSALTAISEVSATIEKSLEQLQQQDTPMSAQHITALTQSVTLIDGYLNSYKQSIKPQALTPENTQSQQDLVSLQAMLEEDTVIAPDNQLSVAQLLEDDIDSLLDAEWQLTKVLKAADIEQTTAYITKQRAQIERLSQKTQESPKFSALLSALDNAYAYLSAHPEQAFDTDNQSILLDGHAQLVDLFDALAASMSLKVDGQVLENLNNLVDDSAETSKLINRPFANEHATTDSSMDDDYHQAQSTDLQSTDVQSDDSQNAYAESVEAQSTDMASVKSRHDIETQSEAIDTDAELLEIFLEEAQQLDGAIAQAFAKWRIDIDDFSALKELQRYLHTIKGGAQMAEIKSIADLTHEIESIYEGFIEAKIEPTLQWVDIMQRVQDVLSLQITHTVNYHESFFAASLTTQLKQLATSKVLPEQVELILPVPKPPVPKPPAPTPITTGVSVEVQNPSQEDKRVSLEDLINSSWPNGLPDSDILDVFLEEAEEITNRNQNLLALISDADTVANVQVLQRDLHTLKGGARMVDASGIADLAHEMETVYESLADGRRPATDTIKALLVACHDWLADAIAILKQQVNPSAPVSLISALQQFIKDPKQLVSIPKESLQEQRRAIMAAQAPLPLQTKLQTLTTTTLQEASSTKLPAYQPSEALAQSPNQQQITPNGHDISVMPDMSGQFAQQEQRADSNEMIRISGGLIEHMINLSGESAINRARIDMGMSSLTGSIEEMGVTVQRLADQLRRMEIELEAQILSQIDEELINHEGFDPLEMDQYSSLNQLSKSLTESASDLIDINSTLLEKTRDSESLLLQLSRTQTELQDGLMNSRMVPFTRLKPRLERTVRQTANQLNKRVALTIKNAEGEIDRTILERITSPLEHMLRNAVDHGIEDAKIRENAGKSSEGNISLEVVREGSEIVIMLTDDGSGIDVEAVRKKAISQGLIQEGDTSLTDVDIMQYIFNAGITTTQKVTQISGRGVGMDVVISEIRQLGGSVSVASETGVGSRFTIRVPLTVAISDALVVRAADRYYAIPLVQIERVVRVNPEKLQDYYQSGAATLQIDDTDYRVRYLNEILSGNALNDLTVSTNVSLPLIIIKNSSGQNIALQVDQIAGSRIEVVVKPLGRQLSHIQGVSAATIMGDGSVMLILDPIALMRNVSMLEPTRVLPKEVSKQTQVQPHILIVDDSVTVRKVTSRFLERQEYTVTLAKDGVDAVEILQETLPDLILLDIEMPRMDGFEVATQIRHSKRLQHIPIIMITSRTGEKHRTRALEIGVNDYMGKPFQENELLDNIQRLLATKNSVTYQG
nr:Hpt domain-containing protein [uncultured Psychrobacter sp.]